MLTLKPTSKKDIVSIRKFPTWADYGDTLSIWSSSFKSNVWFPLKSSGVFTVYTREKYDIVNFSELRLKSKAIIKDDFYIDKVYNDGIEVINQNGYFYGDTIKFKDTYTGIVEVFYPSGIEGFIKNLIFQFKSTQPIILSRISKVKRKFLPKSINSFYSVDTYKVKRKFIPISVNSTYSTDTYRILKKFLPIGTQELYKNKATTTLISEYWNFYSYWAEFRNNRWISYLDPASY